MERERAETIAVYDAKAEELANYFNGIGSRIEDIERAFFIVNKPNPRVLEIGCGNGRDAAEIVTRTADYTGVDVSSSMIALARSALPGRRFEVADIAQYKFPGGIDIIFAFASLLHSDKSEIEDVPARAHPALNPGGVIYISLKQDTYQKQVKRDEFGARTFYFYMPDDIKELAGDAYSSIFEEAQVIGFTSWFTLVLQKRETSLPD